MFRIYLQGWRISFRFDSWLIWAQPANQLTNHPANRKAKDEDLREASVSPARSKHSCVLETWVEHENCDVYICNLECAYANGLRLSEGHDVFILGIAAGGRSFPFDN
jgi:hypothetical protein